MAQSNSKPHDVVRAAFFSLWGVLTLVLLFTVGFLVLQLVQQNERQSVEKDVALAPVSYDGGPVAETGRSISLYFAEGNLIRLTREDRAVALTESTIENCKAAFAALAEGPRANGVAVMPAAAKARAMYLLPSGELVVDLSREVESPAIRSASSEWLLAQAIAHTLTQSALRGPQDRPVTSVRLLYEGSPMSEGFPAHVLLAEPLRPDPLLVGG